MQFSYRQRSAKSSFVECHMEPVSARRRPPAHSERALEMWKEFPWLRAKFPGNGERDAHVRAADGRPGRRQTTLAQAMAMTWYTCAGKRFPDQVHSRFCQCSCARRNPAAVKTGGLVHGLTNVAVNPFTCGRTSKQHCGRNHPIAGDSCSDWSQLLCLAVYRFPLPASRHSRRHLWRVSAPSISRSSPFTSAW